MIELKQTMRERFASVASDLLDREPRLALVLAEISATQFRHARHRHPDRVINVGIREQLMVGVASGLALAGWRPIAHSYAPFLVERPFEQVKLDFGHQGLGAILVSIGASYDWPEGGRTHHAPEDVAVMATLPGWEIHVPGHPDEAELLLRAAVTHDRNVYLRLSAASNSHSQPIATGRFGILRRGTRGVVIAVGPMLDATLAATADLDLTVLYATTIRPFDSATLRAELPTGSPAASVILVEPYLEGTSAGCVSQALSKTPHRLLSIGVRGAELRRYGTPAEHDLAHGLDPGGLRRRIAPFIEWAH